MKGKTIIALVMAVLLVASIVSAVSFANLGTLIYNRIAPQNTPQTGIQTITNTGQNSPGAVCASQTDCPNGNCVCKCAARPAAGGSDALGAADTGTIGSCQSACLARCRAACTPAGSGSTGTISCTSNADCTAGYCRIVPSSTAPSITGTCVPCTLTNQCGTGKICSSGNCVNAPANALQPFGGRCTTNAQCTSGRCSTSAVAAAAGTCLCRTNTDCGTGKVCSSGNCVNAPASALLPNGGRCTTNANCENGYCNPNRVCATCNLNSQCGTGKVCIIPRVNEGFCAPLQATGGVCNENADCSSNNCANMVTLGATRIGRCAARPLSLDTRLVLTGGAITIQNLNIGDRAIAPAKFANGATCTLNTQCTSGLCSAGKCAALKTAGQSCSAALPCATGLECTNSRCVAPATATRTTGQSCSATQPCATGLTCDSLRKVCVAQAAAPRTAGQSCSANQLCATGLTCTGNVCARPVTGSDADTSVGSCQAACTETCRLECTPSAGTKAIGEVCSSPTGCETECETGYGDCRCEGTGTIVTGRTKKQNGESCEAGTQCISEYCDKIFPDRAGVCAQSGATGDKAIGEGCSANTECETGSCQVRNIRTGFARALSLGGGPDAACAEPLARDLEIGEACYIHSQCKSIYCKDRVCAEAPPTPKQPLGERCVENEDCESDYCSTDPNTLRKTCAEQALEALSPEVQTQVRQELLAIEPKLETMERQVVADRLIASREALVAMSGRPDCYVTINDVELKAECLVKRFKTVANLLQSKGIFTADKARELIEKVKENAAAGETTVVPTPPLAAQVSFGSRVMNLFRITGSFWRVTGGFVVDETEVQVGTAGEELRVIEAIPTDYLNDLDTQYNELAALETDICSKYPTTLTPATALKSCSTDAQCGVSGAVKCVSGKCRVNKNDVCTVGEFVATGSGATPPPAEETKICTAPPRTKPIGVTCTANAQCTSRYCNGAVRICADPARFSLKFNGETCTANAQCVSAYCNRAVGICALPPGKKDLGAACTANIQCDSGLCKRASSDATASGDVTDEEIDELLTEGLPVGAPCTERYNCASHYCYKAVSYSPIGACRACTADTNCVAGKTCQSGICAIPPSCTSPISFEIKSVCIGADSGIAFVNISIENTGDIDINEFGLTLYAGSSSPIEPAHNLPLLAAGTEYLQKIRMVRTEPTYTRIRVTPIINTVRCNDKKQFLGIESGPLLPKCNNQPCSGNSDCASRSCTGGVCQ